MSEPTNPPAFPQSLSGADVGMTLRDYFAAKVLPEAIAHERELRTSQINPAGFRYDAIAHAAYAIADAMLKARES